MELFAQQIPSISRIYCTISFLKHARLFLYCGNISVISLTNSVDESGRDTKAHDLAN
jgi:hypothetical protein